MYFPTLEYASSRLVLHWRDSRCMFEGLDLVLKWFYSYKTLIDYSEACRYDLYRSDIPAYPSFRALLSVAPDS
jgi:hypothetical protein